MNAFNKGAASNFSGIATLTRNVDTAQPGSILGAADLYISEWGQVFFVADRFCPANTVYCFDLEYWEACYIRPVTREQLAKTGDSDRVQILTDVGLVCKNPQASGKVAATTTS